MHIPRIGSVTVKLMCTVSLFGITDLRAQTTERPANSSLLKDRKFITSHWDSSLGVINVMLPEYSNIGLVTPKALSTTPLTTLLYQRLFGY